MRTFYVCMGLLCYLLVILTYQPFRDVGRGWAAQQVLGGPPLALTAPPGQNTVVWLTGMLQPEPDVRRLQPFEAEPTNPLLAAAAGGRRAVLAPGSLLVADGGTLPVEGSRVAMLGAPASVPFGSPVAVYGLWQAGSVDVWAAAPDAADLQELARDDTSLLRWPRLLLGALFGALGYALTLAGSLVLRQALLPAGQPGPRLATASLALYVLLGYLLLSSAWAMLLPTLAGVLLTVATVWWLGPRRRAARQSAAR